MAPGSIVRESPADMSCSTVCTVSWSTTTILNVPFSTYIVSCFCMWKWRDVDVWARSKCSLFPQYISLLTIHSSWPHDLMWASRPERLSTTIHLLQSLTGGLAVAQPGDPVASRARVPLVASLELWRHRDLPDDRCRPADGLHHEVIEVPERRRDTRADVVRPVVRHGLSVVVVRDRSHEVVRDPDGDRGDGRDRDEVPHRVRAVEAERGAAPIRTGEPEGDGRHLALVVLVPTEDVEVPQGRRPGLHPSNGGLAHGLRETVRVNGMPRTTVDRGRRAEDEVGPRLGRGPGEVLRVPEVEGHQRWRAEVLGVDRSEETRLNSSHHSIS